MSVKQMALVWEHDFEHNDMLVMLALTDHADHDGGSIFPSVDRIAWKTAYSEKQVRNIIKGLRERGVLVIVAKSTPTRPNEYRIDWTTVKKKPAYRGVKITTPISGVEENGVMGGNLEPKTGDRVVIAITTEPSLKTNHHIEPSLGEYTYEPLEGALPQKLGKDPRYQHPAIKIYRTRMHLQVHRDWVDEAIRVVGQEPASLTKWDTLLRDWNGNKWNPGNVKGQLEAFQNGGLKRTQKPSFDERVKHRMELFDGDE